MLVIILNIYFCVLYRCCSGDVVPGVGDTTLHRRTQGAVRIQRVKVYLDGHL